MIVRALQAEDLHAWFAMRRVLWSDSDMANAEAWRKRSDSTTIVAQVDDTAGVSLAGFAEAGERLYADGCDSSPVAFLEGWYVEPPYRHRGVGRLLVQAVEDWARGRGLSELASDSLLAETAAQAAHEAVGFEEVERAVRYRKPLF